MSAETSELDDSQLRSLKTGLIDFISGSLGKYLLFSNCGITDGSFKTKIHDMVHISDKDHLNTFKDYSIILLFMSNFFGILQ